MTKTPSLPILSTKELNNLQKLLELLAQHAVTSFTAGELSIERPPVLPLPKNDSKSKKEADSFEWKHTADDPVIREPLYPATPEELESQLYNLGLEL